MKKQNKNTKNKFSMEERPVLRGIFTEPMAYLGQVSSGVGAITANQSNRSLTGAISCELDPYTIGGRLYAIAFNFLQYRVRGGRLRYVPMMTSSGVSTLVAGPSTTPSYAVRDFVVKVYRDPRTAATSYSNGDLLMSGARACRTTQPFQISIPRSSWLWTSTSASSSISSIDYRQAAFGALVAQFRDTSTTASVLYGDLIFDLDVEFRYPCQSTPLALQASLTSKSKDDESKRISKDPAKGWFTQ